MKRYKLLKDLPTFKAGGLFYISEYGALVYDDGGFGVMAYAQSTLEKFPNILTEWFEEIKEPTNSSNWKPQRGDKIWYLDENGNTNFTYFDEDDSYHLSRFEFGNTYRTSGECELARERRLAKVRLQRTSDFNPDFESGNGGYAVFYNYLYRKLYSMPACRTDVGEPVRYATEEDAEKSIKENERDWKIYFGIKEEK
ncbi:hypothetical protein LRM47_00775 [Candidatus Nanosynbacter sp. TM7-076]|uniref:hypothetical protein n=1 Tax=Candidatus Nanosynbacter sp. TM7-076 TaxID=2902629 RepID=UPI001FB6E936|nr:hypothetical protein [Candidatus Nanosynbacter sp. TM7-076]MCJ1967573.1 hypothetical protein [Candidatus Nanosynbacter sp. TM7-076]